MPLSSPKPSPVEEAPPLRRQQQQQQKRRRKLDLNANEELVMYGLYKQATEGDAPHRGRFWLSAKRTKHRFWNQVSTTLSEEALAEALGHIEQALAIVLQQSRNCSSSSSMPPNKSPDATTTMPSSPATTETTTKTDIKHSSLLAVSSPVLSKTEEESSTQLPEELLLSAAAENDLVTVRTLLQRGRITNIDHRDVTSGQTALHVAADMGFFRLVQLLLENGADCDVVDDDGISALQAAVIGGHVMICKELLRQGADPDLPDQDGDTARLCAMDDGSITLRDLFAKLDANYDDCNDYGEKGRERYMDGGADEERSLATWKTDFPLTEYTHDDEYNHHGSRMVDFVPSSFQSSKCKTMML